jgi:hypothetical protein
MKDADQELRAALHDFMAAAATKDSAQIAPALNRVLECEAELGPETHPQLRHYLERRSYQKALDWLGGGAPEQGRCGR